MPWAISASRSISPKRIPPARLRPCDDTVSFAVDHGSRIRSTHLHWLPCEWIDGPCRSHLEFVKHHVPEALVVHDPDVNVGCELLPGDAGVHRFVAIVVVSRGEKLLPEIVYSSILLSEPEGSLVYECMKCTDDG